MCGGRTWRPGVRGAASATREALRWLEWDGARLGRGRRRCRSHQLGEDGGAREMKTRSVLEHGQQ